MKTLLADLPLDENRMVRIYAPISVTKAELERINAWLATQLYVTDKIAPKAK